MSVTNKIEVIWEFDIETNEELQRRLALTEGEIEALLSDDHDANKLHTLCCDELCVPMYIDLDLFFDNPHSVSDDHITDVISDEWGWTVKSWQYVQQRFNPEDD